LEELMPTNEPQPTNDPLTTTPSTTPHTLSDRSGVTDAGRAQLLATEHNSLLATRSMTWAEIFSRASMFITVLSAVVVAPVAQAAGFWSSFRPFALLALPITLLVGMSTSKRLSDANIEDL
jgi:hypothetical protein